MISGLIQELLDLQLIERSESHYSCSAFLVRNHSEIVRGKDRMVINYKPLNAITKSFNYPMPRQETIMQKIHGSKIFSKFDLKSGYYQIQIAEEDRHKTAFTCPAGFFQWKVVPFGLKNAPAFFQRRMDRPELMEGRLYNWSQISEFYKFKKFLLEPT